MYCPYCRTNLPNGTSVCPNCGGSILDAPGNNGGNPGNNQNVSGPQPRPTNAKHSSNTKVLIIAAAAVVVIAIIAIATVLIVGMTRVPEPSPEATDAAKTIETPDISEVTEEIEEEKKKEAPNNSSSDSNSSSSSSSSDSSSSSNSSQTSSNSGTESAPASTTKDFDLNGASCQVPKLWVVMHKDSDTGYAAPYSGSSLVSYSRDTTPNIMRLDLVDLAIAYALDDGNGTYKNIKVVGEPSTAKLDDGAYEAIRIETTSEFEGRQIHVIDQWVRTDDATYLLSARCDASEWESNKGELIAVLDSMHMGTLPTSGYTSA